MYSYKITKYCFKNKDKAEKEVFNEWTSISDIGKIYNGKKFLYEEYIKTENNYIETILMFIKLNNVKYMMVDDLEKHTNRTIVYDKYDFQIEKLIKKVQNKMKINIRDINLLSRAILRERIWAKLYFNDELYIHFGYDYYMYIGSKLEPKKEIEQIKKFGLDIEPMISPYNMK